MSKIMLSGHILIPSENLEAVLAAMPSHIAASRAEPGCLVFDLNEDPNVPGRFNLYEEFVDGEAFEQHQQRTKSSPWARISKNVKRNYQVTEQPSEGI